MRPPALRISLVLNIIFIAFLAFLVYKSGIIQNFGKQKEPQVKEIPAPVKIAKPEQSLKPAVKPTAVSKPPAKKIEKTYVAPPKEKTETKTVTLTKPPVVPVTKVQPPKPRLVFVIDDIGNTMAYRQNLEKLEDNVTYAILPKLSYSKYFSSLSLKTGAEVIVHLPLEALNNTYPGPGLIETDMSATQIRKILNSDLDTVSYYVGINNHMGSQGTQDARLMTILLKEIKAKGLFFLDSRTSTMGIPSKLGKEIGLPVLQRDVFLDNEDDRQYIKGQLQEVREVARKKGYAIAIGHYRFNTLQVLAEEIPELKKEGFAIVSLSDIFNSESH